MRGSSLGIAGRTMSTMQGGSINDGLTNLETMSMLSSSKNRELGSKIKEIEKILSKKLSNNWVSVRKAFLDLDTDYDGFITAEDFANLIGSSAGFDFN